MEKKEVKLMKSYLSEGKNLGEIDFFIVRRHRHLFLGLPRQRSLAKKAVQLYQPQKWKGRLLALGLRVSIATGLYTMGAKLRLKVGDEGLVHILRKRFNSRGFGFLLGSVDSQHRSIAAVTEAYGKVVVVKAALGDAASSVEREYQNLRAFASRVEQAIKPIDAGSFADGFYYVTEHIIGDSPRGIKQHTDTLKIIENWLDKAPKMSLANISSWQEMVNTTRESDLVKTRFESVENTEVHAPIGHGDYVPWNVKIDKLQQYHILDWESALGEHVPGWDMWHYWFQKWILIDEYTPAEAFLKAENWLNSETYQNYLSKAGCLACSKEILGGYLYYSGYVQGYDRVELISEWEEKFL